MRVSILVISLVLLGCQNKQTTMIEMEKYSHDQLMLTETIEQIVEKSHDRTSILFKGQFVDTVYYFTVYNDNKNEIEFMGHKSKLIDKRTLNVGAYKFEILKYRYDEIDSFDEELDFYLTEDGDILGFREVAWNGYEIFLQDDNKHLLTSLTSDSTDFFKYNYRFRF